MHFLLNVPAFVLATSLLAIVPGQGMAMVLRQSFVGGPGYALISVLGNSTGLVFWGILSGIGLSAVFANNHSAYLTLKWCGVAFLVYLALQTAWQLRLESGKFNFSGRPSVHGRVNRFAAYRVGLFTNLTNVKAAVFAVAFLPVYVPSDFNLGLGIALLGFVWAMVSTFWYLVLIFMVKRAARALEKPAVRRGLTAASAVGLLLLAAGLALS